ncbi:GYD domain-containing protein [Candidatus Fermentibacteria bacterium]|nr:GYD domain-containing protein [Candidatus Fermentibacteria bacterium]
MPTYVLMTKLGPDLAKEMKHRREIGREWRKRVRELCPSIKFVAHYALLGAYDFLDIFEASNEEEAALVSMVSRSAGAVSAESWTAIPYAKFLELSEKV